MAATMKMVGFTVPSAMAEELEQMAKEEQRTKSELFREMFRVYRTYRRELARVEQEHIERIAQRTVQEAEERGG
jgi:metal-responsive CopG/Arc/MetJ family transcriptional regulator